MSDAIEVTNVGPTGFLVRVPDTALHRYDRHADRVDSLLLTREDAAALLAALQREFPPPACIFCGARSPVRR
jgi:hypothetical protein